MSGSTRSIYEVLDESLLVEYCIKTRTFDQFKKIFKTNKYLSRNYYIMVNLQNEIFNVPAFFAGLVEWYEINSQLDVVVQKSKAKGKFYCRHLSVSYEFIENNKCRLKLDQSSYKVLRVTIQDRDRETHVSVSKNEDASDDSLYDPTETKLNGQKPVTQIKHELEYVPKELNSNDSTTSSPPSCYVPSTKNDNFEEYTPVAPEPSSSSACYIPSKISNEESSNSQDYSQSIVRKKSSERDENESKSANPLRKKSSKSNLHQEKSKSSQESKLKENEVVSNSEDEGKPKSKGIYKSHKKIVADNSDEDRENRKRTRKKKILQTELFGGSSDDDKSKTTDNHEASLVPCSSRTGEDDIEGRAKRQKLDKQFSKQSVDHDSKSSKDRGKDKHSSDKDSKRKTLRDKGGTESPSMKQTGINRWITSDKKSSTTTASSKSSSKTTKPSTSTGKSNSQEKAKDIGSIEEEKQMEEMVTKYNELTSKMKLYDDEVAARKKELATLKIYNFTKISDEKLSKYIEKFSAMIMERIERYKKVSD